MFAVHSAKRQISSGMVSRDDDPQQCSADLAALKAQVASTRSEVGAFNNQPEAMSWPLAARPCRRCSTWHRNLKQGSPRCFRTARQSSRATGRRANRRRRHRCGTRISEQSARRRLSPIRAIGSRLWAGMRLHRRQHCKVQHRQALSPLHLRASC